MESQKKGLLLFVTHFPEVGALAARSHLHGRIGAYHMGFLNSDGGGGGVGDQVSRVPKVTFLYKVQGGACDRSFGLNVAQMAGVPDRVVQRSGMLSHEFEADGGEKSRKRGSQKRRRPNSACEVGSPEGPPTEGSAATLAELRGGLVGAAFTGSPEVDARAQARVRELLQRLQT